MCAADPPSIPMSGDPPIDARLMRRPTRAPLRAGQDLGDDRGGHEIQRIGHETPQPGAVAA
jgi:hypothetical protein